MANLEVFYKPNNTLTVKLEARGLEEIFQELGPVQEILGQCKCGKCGGESIRFLHRKTAPDADNKTHDAYELLCETLHTVKTSDGNKQVPCGHKLQIGKNTDQQLFPKKYEMIKEGTKWVPKLDADGKKVYFPNNGWVRWDRKANDGKGGYV